MSRRLRALCLVGLMALGSTGCAATDPVGPATACSQREIGLFAPWLWRWRVLVLVDSRFDAPPELPALIAGLERASTSGDLDDDGERDFMGQVDARMEVRNESFDEPLVRLLERAMPSDWYEQQLPWFVLLVSAGDVGPEFYPEPDDLPDAVWEIGIVGGLPPELVEVWHSDREAALADPRMSSDEPLCSRADGVDPLPGPRFLDVPPLGPSTPFIVSLCSARWDEELLAPLVEAMINHRAAGHCYELPPAETGDGRVACTMYELPAAAAPFDCEELPGRLPAPSDDQPRRCAIVQQPPVATGEPPEPGWFADDRTVWNDSRCGGGGQVFWRFTRDAHPMPGSEFWLECLTCTDVLGDTSVAEPDGGR